MTSSSRRPQTFIGRAATVSGLYAAAAFLAGLLPFARLHGGIPVLVSAILVMVAFSIGRYLLREGGATSPTRASIFWTQFGSITAGAVFVVSTLFAVHASVLACRGEKVSATVDGVYPTGRGRSRFYRYRLVDADGNGVPGYLIEGSQQFPVGSRLTVVVEPDGLVDPETASEVKDAKPLWLINGVGFAATSLMALWSARSRPRERFLRRGSGGP